MTPEERRFLEERQRRLKLGRKIREDGADEIASVLSDGSREILRRLSVGSGEFTNAFLVTRFREIEQILAGIGLQAAEQAAALHAQTVLEGVEMIDTPIAADGIRLNAVFSSIPDEQILAMRSFLTDKISDITLETSQKIRSQLGLSVIGSQDRVTTLDNVSRLLEETTPNRARVIVNTELGRAYSTATQERLKQGSELLPGLGKEWQQSDRIRQRPEHMVADGQIVGVNEAFTIGGEKLDYPRDPKGTPKNTINCGCDMLPHMSDFKV